MKSLSKLLSNTHLVQRQIYSIASFAVQSIAGIAILFVVTRYISPEDLGIYRYVLAIMSLVSIFAIPGFNKTIPGYVSKKIQGVVKLSTDLSLKGSVISVAILILLGIYSAHYASSIESSLFFIAAVVFIPYAIFSRYEFVLQGLHLFKKLFLFRSLFSILQIASVFLVLLILEQGVLAFGISQLLIQFVLFSSYYYHTVGLLTNDKVDKEFFDHSKAITYYGLVGRAILPSLEVLLNSTLGPATLAIYFVSKKIADIASSATHQLMRPVSMQISSTEDHFDKQAMLKRVMPISLLMGMLFFVVIYFGIDAVGKYLVGEAYFEALEYAKIFSIVVIFTPFQSLLVSNAIYERKNSIYRDSLYINYAIQILGYSMFSYAYGLYAVSIIFVLAYLANFLVLLRAFLKYQYDRDLIKNVTR